MPPVTPINPDTVPGSVTVPTWLLVGAVAVLFTIRELERRGWFKTVGDLTKALADNTGALEKVGDALAGLKDMVVNYLLQRKSS